MENLQAQMESLFIAKYAVLICVSPYRNYKVVTSLWLTCDKVVYNEQGDDNAVTTS